MLVDQDASVVDALIHVVVVPLMLHHREDLHPLADIPLGTDILRAIIFELLPAFRIMLRQISGSAAVGFRRLTGNREISDQVLTRLILLLPGLESLRRFFQGKRQRQGCRMYHGTTPGIRG